MGERVATIGHMDVRPALNDEEYSYLTGFAESRRWRRPEGGLWVAPTPFDFGDDRAYDREDYNTPPDGQPSLWCSWRPSCEGRCLSVVDIEQQPRQLVGWLRFLIDEFLSPQARAVGHPGFEDFSFDHEVSGVVVTHHQGSGQLALIQASGGVVQQEVLRAADADWWAA